VGATPAGRTTALRRTPAAVRVPLTKGGAATLGAARKSATSSITLTFSGVAGTGVHGVLFEIYVGAGEGRGTHVGNLSLFGFQPDDHSGGHHGGGSLNFDVTKAAPAAAKNVTVTLVPINVSGTASLPEGTLATIERMVLSVQGAAVTAKPKKKRQTPRQRNKARPARKGKTGQPNGQRRGTNARPRNVNRQQKRGVSQPAHTAHGAAGPDVGVVPGNKSSAGDLVASDVSHEPDHAALH
jgi:hypothetical protein